MKLGDTYKGGGERLRSCGTSRSSLTGDGELVRFCGGGQRKAGNGRKTRA